MNYLRFIGPAIAVLFFLSCGRDKQADEPGTIEETSSDIVRPAVMSYSVVHVYPHDPAAFTEGLEYHNGFLYESTGLYGTSELRKTELTTGKTLQSVKLDRRYFGEGMTIMGDKIYQLTYREHTGFVYDLNTMKQLQTFGIATEEAWGLTNDGTHLIYGDGTSSLYFLDPATFKEVKRIRVRDQYGPVNNINELEFIKGSIYANQWQTDNILKIDPETGNITGIADLRTIRLKLGIPDAARARHEDPEVMNGIAYDAEGDRIFITGKYWPHLVEIKL